MKFPEQFRQRNAPHGYATNECEPFGFFHVPGRLANGRSLQILAASANEPDGIEWEHVSVSLPEFPTRTPSWAEMQFVKDLFWEPSEVVMQLHVAATNHVNIHEGCLHLWRPTKEAIPLPPKVCV